MKKHFLAIALILVIIGVNLSAGGKPEAADKSPSTASKDSYEKATIRLTTNGTETAADTILAKLIAEEVKKETNGIVDVQVFPNDQLAGGNQTKGIEMLTQGTADLGVYSNSIIGGVLNDKLLAASIPFTFANYEEASAIYDSTGGAFAAKILSEKGLVYLGSIHNGLRQFSNNKRSISSPDDMKGLKIRVMGSEIYLDIFKTLGADPIVMSWAEVYTALQQKTIDGQDNGFKTSASTKMYEVQKHFTRINYTYDSFLVVANANSYGKLPVKTKTMLEKIINKSVIEIRAQVVADEEKFIQLFKKEHGVEITELTSDQVQVFKTRLAPVIQKFKDKYGPEACAAFGVK